MISNSNLCVAIRFASVLRKESDKICLDFSNCFDSPDVDVWFVVDIDDSGCADMQYFYVGKEPSKWFVADDRLVVGDPINDLVVIRILDRMAKDLMNNGFMRALYSNYKLYRQW